MTLRARSPINNLKIVFLSARSFNLAAFRSVQATAKRQRNDSVNQFDY